jgi:hypothetical protein
VVAPLCWLKKDQHDTFLARFQSFGRGLRRRGYDARSGGLRPRCGPFAVEIINMNPDAAVKYRDLAIQLWPIERVIPYAIASSADQVYVTRTGGVGSVGVIALHVDQSRYDAKMGRVYTAIFAGARKNDFNPHEPLSEAATSGLRMEIDRLYEIFVQTVARNRDLKAALVRNTEAGIFYGGNALVAGLADRVGTFDDALEALRQAVFQTDGDATSGAVRGRMEYGDRAGTLKFTARFENGSSELTKLKALTTGTAVINLHYDASNSLEITWQKIAFATAEVGETSGIVTVNVDCTPIYDATNGLLSVVAKCGVDAICQ